MLYQPTISSESVKQLENKFNKNLKKVKFTKIEMVGL